MVNMFRRFCLMFAVLSYLYIGRLNNENSCSHTKVILSLLAGFLFVCVEACAVLNVIATSTSRLLLQSPFSDIPFNCEREPLSGTNRGGGAGSRHIMLVVLSHIAQLTDNNHPCCCCKR